MPFKSRRQEKWAFATGQPFAEEWAAMTDQKKLKARAKPDPKPSKKKSARKRTR